DKLMHAQPGEFLNSVKGVLIDVGTYIGQGILSGATKGLISATGGARYSSTVQGSSAKAWRNLWDDTGGAAANWLTSKWTDEDVSETPLLGAGGLGGAFGAQASDKPPAWVNNIAHYAEGGTVTKPTLAVLGEAGIEDVVPRGKSGGRMGGI